MTQLQPRFAVCDLAFEPTTPAQLDRASRFDEDIPVFDPGASLDSEAYLEGVAYGRLRRLQITTDPQAEPEREEIAVFDVPPAEMFVPIAGALTATRQAPPLRGWRGRSGSDRSCRCTSPDRRARRPPGAVGGWRPRRPGEHPPALSPVQRGRIGGPHRTRRTPRSHHLQAASALRLCPRESPAMLPGHRMLVLGLRRHPRRALTTRACRAAPCCSPRSDAPRLALRGGVVPPRVASPSRDGGRGTVAAA